MDTPAEKTAAILKAGKYRRIAQGIIRRMPAHSRPGSRTEEEQVNAAIRAALEDAVDKYMNAAENLESGLAE